MQTLSIVSKRDDMHGEGRCPTFNLSLSALDLGAAFGPSDCWIRSSFFFCRETTYYSDDVISKVKIVSEVRGIRTSSTLSLTI